MLQWFSEYALYFYIYSIIGWIWETLFCSLKAGKFMNRGFLFGPWCPIYGSGLVLILWVCSWFNFPWWINFFLIIFVCDTVEYWSSVYMEKLYHVRWWDYTNNTKVNLNGRISLETSIGFGAGGTFVKYFVHPTIAAFVLNIPMEMRILIIFVLTIIFVIDNVMSNIAAISVKDVLKGGHVDLTAEIKKFAINYYKKQTRRRRKIARAVIRRMKKAQKQTIKQFKKANKSARKALRIENRKEIAKHTYPTKPDSKA